MVMGMIVHFDLFFMKVIIATGDKIWRTKKYPNLPLKVRLETLKRRKVKTIWHLIEGWKGSSFFGRGVMKKRFHLKEIIEIEK